MGQTLSKGAADIVSGVKQIAEGAINVVEGAYVCVSEIAVKGVQAVGYVVCKTVEFIGKGVEQAVNLVVSGVKAVATFVSSSLNKVAERLYLQTLDVMNAIKAGGIDEELSRLLKERLSEKYTKLKKQADDNELKAKKDWNLLSEDDAKVLYNNYRELEQAFIDTTQKLKDNAFDHTGIASKVKLFESLASEFYEEYERSTGKKYVNNFKPHTKYCVNHGYTCAGEGCQCSEHGC